MTELQQLIVEKPFLSTCVTELIDILEVAKFLIFGYKTFTVYEVADILMISL